jgi:hypothetical protein
VIDAARCTKHCDANIAVVNIKLAKVDTEAFKERTVIIENATPPKLFIVVCL